MRTAIAAFTVACIAALFGAWVLAQGGTLDPVKARDEFVAAGPLVVDYGDTEAVLTWLPDGRWVANYSGPTLFTGAEYLTAVEPGCYWRYDEPPENLPLIPGLTIAPRLRDEIERGYDRGAREHTYSVPRENPFTVEVTEDLSRIEEGVLIVETRSAARGGYNGTFTIRRASEGEVAEATALLEGARGSEVVRVVYTSFNPVVGTSANPPFADSAVEILRECPQAPVVVSTPPFVTSQLLFGTYLQRSQLVIERNAPGVWGTRNVRTAIGESVECEEPVEWFRCE